MSELIEIQGLTKAYDAQHVAVNNVSLVLPQGKIIGLLAVSYTHLRAHETF